MSSSFTRILAVLSDAEVEIIVVGMAAAIAQGVPLNTLDLDLVHRRTEANVDRLFAALTGLHAVYRTDSRGIPVRRDALLGPGHQLLRTDAGLVDCLGVMSLGGHDRTYEELVDRSVVVRLEHRAVRMLSLETYVQAKREAARPKDLAVLPVLEATLREIRARRGG